MMKTTQDLDHLTLSELESLQSALQMLSLVSLVLALCFLYV